MSFIIAPPNDQNFSQTVGTSEPNPPSLIPSSLPTSSHALSSALPQGPVLNSLSVLSSGLSGGRGSVGGTRDPSVSLSHVLSGLQEEEGALAEVLQHQPNLAHGTWACKMTCHVQAIYMHVHPAGLNTIDLGDVSSDPESLRFQYQPVDDLSQHTQTPKKKTKSVYREQVVP